MGVEEGYEKQARVTSQKTPRLKALSSTPIFYAAKQSLPHWKADYKHAGYVKEATGFLSRENQLVVALKGAGKMAAD